MKKMTTLHLTSILKFERDDALDTILKSQLEIIKFVTIDITSQNKINKLIIDHKWSRTNYCSSGEKEWILWRPSLATFLSSEVSSSPPFSLTRLSSTRVSPTMVFKCRNIAAFKFWGGNITIWSRKISWFFERYYRSWEFFSRIFFLISENLVK